ncbi:MAG: lipopolysaccharide heptosyltransferase II [Campylobacterota bacterium]|nr:lipopolysaccharide heptosyltransferase II [Campylobacterota bacterium]
MKILVILPNWLGDAVMATPAIESLLQCGENVHFTFVGSFVSIEALKYHPQCTNAYIDETKKEGNRFINTYNFAKKLQGHDLAISFRNQLHASLLLKWSNTPISIARKSWHATLFLTHTLKLSREEHLVVQYNALANKLTNQKNPAQDLKLYIPKTSYERPTLGINPGATYGSAKRWYPEKFAQVAQHFSNSYDIVIFGGPSEIEMADEIENTLLSLHVNNVKNLAGKTDIKALCSHIGGLELFITNDSGPMHVGAAYHVPTVAIFGPTRHKETSQWSNPKGYIVRHDMECSPCMKRECPLKHHECMKSISAQEVIEAVSLNS